MRSRTEVRSLQRLHDQLGGRTELVTPIHGTSAGRVLEKLCTWLVEKGDKLVKDSGRGRLLFVAALPKRL